MRLWNKIEIIEPYPAIYISALNAIVIADLQLGYEGIMAEKGIFIPKVQFKHELQTLKEIIKAKKAERIIINGDIKHEFSETSYHEFKEVGDLLSFLNKEFKDITLIKGNHDNFIVYATKRHGVRLCKELELGEFYFFHGHQNPRDFAKIEADYLILAHEHPAIALFDEVGTREKIGCFLYGKVKEKKILVLPAFSTLAQGSEVNVLPKGELLSPFLKEFVEVENLKVIGISQETGCLKFPELGKLRYITSA